MLALKQAIQAAHPFSVPPFSIRQLLDASQTTSVLQAIRHQSVKDTVLVLAVRDAAAVGGLCKATWPKNAFFSAAPPSREAFKKFNDELQNEGCKLAYVSPDWKTIAIRAQYEAILSLEFVQVEIKAAPQLVGPGLHLLDVPQGVATAAEGVGIAAAAVVTLLTLPATVPVATIVGLGIAFDVGAVMAGSGIYQTFQPSGPTPPPVINNYNYNYYGVPPANDTQDSPPIKIEDLPNAPINVEDLPDAAPSPHGSIDDPASNAVALGYSQPTADGGSGDGDAYFGDPDPADLGGSVPGEPGDEGESQG